MSNGPTVPGRLPPNDELDSDELLSRLVEFDEALAAGQTLDLAVDPTLKELPDPTRKRLRRVLRCLEFLDQVRRAKRGTKGNGKAPDIGEKSLTDLPDAGELRLKVGRFEVVRELGRGGHGVVFLANDPLLRRQVALKVPRPEFILSPGMGRRFVGEAQAAAALDHPNILKVFEAGSDRAISFIAQELCIGPSLAEWLRESTDVNPIIAATIVRDLARGVEHAHQRGVLHRDLKPANVLLQPLEEDKSRGTGNSRQELGLDSRLAAGGSSLPFTPKLADFGIAKVFGEEADRTATATGEALGTVAYMSPEQAAGRTSQIGPQSDIYGLGAILYELLTGRPPFELDSRATTLQRVIADEPPAPRSLRPKVPRDIDAICLKCLEKLRADRYASAEAVAADLDRFLAGEAVSVRPVARLGRTIRRLRRLPPSTRIALGAITLLVGCLVAIIMLIWGTPRAGTTGQTGQPSHPEAEYLDGIEHVSQGYSDSVANRGDVKTAVRALDAFLERHRPRPGEADYRGFEWHYLWRLCHPDLVAQPFPKLFDLVGHQGEVYSVTFSPDGKRLATAGQDHTGRIWDAGTGRLIATLTGHTDDVNWISFYPVAGDPHVLTASDDKTVRIWDCESGKLEGVLSGGGAKVVAVEVALSQYHHGDETLFKYEIIGGDDVGHLRVWDWQTRRELRVIPAHAGRIECIARIRGADQWITASADGTAKEWNSSSWTSTRSHIIDSTAEDGNPVIHSVASNTEATVVAFGGGRDGRFTSHIRKDGSGTAIVSSIPVDDLLTGARWLTLVGPQTAKEDVQFYPGQLLVASTARGDAAEDRTHHVVFWDIPTQTYWTPCGTTVPECWCGNFSADGTRYATATADGVVRVWDSSNLPNGRRLEGTNHIVDRAPTSISYSPNGKRLLVTHGGWGYRVPGHRFAIWDVAGERPKVVSAESTENNPIDSYAGCFSADGKFIAVDSSELEFDPLRALSSSIRILEVASLRESRHLDGYYGVANKILMSPDGENVVASTGNRFRKRTQLNFWLGTHGGRADQIWESKHVGDFVASALSPDGKLLATNRDQVEIYEFPALRLVKTLPFALRGGAICFSPDGQMLAAGGEDGIIHLCHPRLADCAQTLVADGHMVLSLAFSPDGTRLAAGVDGGTRVDLWHVASGKRLAPLAMPNGLVSVTDLSFSPDCRTLAAAGSIQREAGSVFLFPLDSVDKLAKKGQP